MMMDHGECDQPDTAGRQKERERGGQGTCASSPQPLGFIQRHESHRDTPDLSEVALRTITLTCVPLTRQKRALTLLP